MGKTMSVVSLFKFILFFALVKMFYSLLDYIKKNRSIEFILRLMKDTKKEKSKKKKSILKKGM